MPEYAEFTNTIGRVISEPVIRGSDDKRVVKFTISKRTGFKKPEDQYDPSQLYDVSVWETFRSGSTNKLFDQIVNGVRKGHRVAVESGEPKANGQYNPELQAWNVWRLSDLEEEAEGGW